MKQVVDIFIIPTGKIKFEELRKVFPSESIILNARLEAWIGQRAEPSDRMVQIGYQSQTTKDIKFPTWIPERLFQGITETGSLACPGCCYGLQAEFRLNQLGSKYNKFGQFEEVLEKLPEDSLSGWEIID